MTVAEIDAFYIVSLRNELPCVALHCGHTRDYGTSLYVRSRRKHVPLPYTPTSPTPENATLPQNPQSPASRSRSKLPTLPNLTNIENAQLRQILPPQRLPQLPRRLQHILLGKHPSTPMNAHRPPTARIDKDIHAVEGIRMHRRHDPPRIIRPDRNEA